MKLASYADGSRDGHLVVVSRDLTQAHYATGIATRLQQVLDDWGFLAPQLEDLAVQLNHGKLRHAFAFEPDKCLAPLPRAFGWAVVDGEGGIRRDAGHFAPPHQPLRAPAMGEAVLAGLTGDLSAASDAPAALDALRLLTLAVDWRVAGELVATQAAPLAVTPGELGEGWNAGRLQARLVALHNGSKREPRDVSAEPGDALARVARLRALRAGQVVGASLGALDVALAAGDSLHLDLKTADGNTCFGAIDLELPAA
ncbi:fumarylacetoacetate hydrolase [Pelomonas cellulosilytica]|uniref:Fumarylacetoacetate hydrolase n=1 Tax=Pelomonas cellulosilytica TaxID=2906762 RepID=A0ABS8XZP7_9BURK|nr:fumarylacetoacetate hydrolase [Pelomonas sp. P8]MCE4557468.1 fumarylacetoacetate hydrolase [Pelomonas sp. P8]